MNTESNQQPNQIEKVDEEMSQAEHFAQQRWRICRDCEHLKLLLCSQCGCFMPAKTRLRRSSCPLGKWRAAE